MAHASVDVAAQEGQQRLGGVFLPAVDADQSVAHVGTEDDALRAVFLQPRDEAVGVGHGYGTHRHHTCPVAEGGLDVVVGLDATAEIDGEACCSGDFLQGLVVDDVARLRPVEVNHVETAKPDSFKFGGHLGRTVAVDRLLGVVALGQPDALSVDDVYGRDEFYHSSRKFFRMVSPVAPLFSGWNWQA